MQHQTCQLLQRGSLEAELVQESSQAPAEGSSEHEHELTSVTAALDVMGFGRWQAFMVLYCGLAWFADACEVMLLSYLGPSLRCAWGLSPSAESTLTSVVFFGMLCGVYSLGAVSDALGRRGGFFASAVLLGAAGVASAAAPSFPVLLLLRALVGVGLGGTPVAVTLAAEFLPSRSRGRWLLFMQLWWTLGTAFEAGLAWAVLGPLGWRWLLVLSALPLFLLLLLYPWLPESPHWLVAHGRYEAAEAVIRRVAELCRTTVILYVVWFANALTYYGLVLLTTALQTATKREPCTPHGGPNLGPGDYLTILITATAEAPGLLAAAALIDTRGRKWTLRAGLLLCGGALLLLLGATPWRAGALLLLFVARGGIEATFSVLYVYSPEVYPTHVRNTGLALCNAFSRLGGFLAPYATVQLVEGGHSRAAELLLGSVCMIAALAAFLLPHETRGHDLASLHLSAETGWEGVNSGPAEGSAGVSSSAAGASPPKPEDEAAEGKPDKKKAPAAKPKLCFAFAKDDVDVDEFAEFNVGLDDLDEDAAAPTTAAPTTVADGASRGKAAAAADAPSAALLAATGDPARAIVDRLNDAEAGEMAAPAGLPPVAAKPAGRAEPVAGAGVPLATAAELPATEPQLEADSAPAAAPALAAASLLPPTEEQGGPEAGLADPPPADLLLALLPPTEQVPGMSGFYSVTDTGSKEVDADQPMEEASAVAEPEAAAPAAAAPAAGAAAVEARVEGEPAALITTPMAAMPTAAKAVPPPTQAVDMMAAGEEEAAEQEQPEGGVGETEEAAPMAVCGEAPAAAAQLVAAAATVPALPAADSDEESSAEQAMQVGEGKLIGTPTGGQKVGGFAFGTDTCKQGDWACIPRNPFVQVEEVQGGDTRPTPLVLPALPVPALPVLVLPAAAPPAAPTLAAAGAHLVRAAPTAAAALPSPVESVPAAAAAPAPKPGSLPLPTTDVAAAKPLAAAGSAPLPPKPAPIRLAVDPEARAEAAATQPVRMTPAATVAPQKRSGGGTPRLPSAALRAAPTVPAAPQKRSGGSKFPFLAVGAPAPSAPPPALGVVPPTAAPAPSAFAAQTDAAAAAPPPRLLPLAPASSNIQQGGSSRRVPPAFMSTPPPPPLSAGHLPGMAGGSASQPRQLSRFASLAHSTKRPTAAPQPAALPRPAAAAGNPAAMATPARHGAPAAGAAPPPPRPLPTPAPYTPGGAPPPAPAAAPEAAPALLAYPEDDEVLSLDFACSVLDGHDERLAAGVASFASRVHECVEIQGAVDQASGAGHGERMDLEAEAMRRQLGALQASTGAETDLAGVAICIQAGMLASAYAFMDGPAAPSCIRAVKRKAEELRAGLEAWQVPPPLACIRAPDDGQERAGSMASAAAEEAAQAAEGDGLGLSQAVEQGMLG
eukprot:scaffold4.g4750.t1